MENHKNKIKSGKTKFNIRKSVTLRLRISTLQCPSKDGTFN